MNTAIFLKRPAWRPSAGFSESDAGFSVHLRLSQCVIECNDAGREPLRRLFTQLNHGLDADELARDYGDFADDALEVIGQLDRFGYLTDSAPTQRLPVVDAQAFRRAVGMTIEAAGLEVSSPFTEALLANSATRQQLVRYVIEYYHIVRNAPALVSPLLNCPWTPRLRTRLADFLGSEWRHDRLIARSLKSVQVDTDELVPATMLAPTFALLAQLGVRATSNPLSLAALLSLFERPNDVFHEAFARNCQRLKLPAAFLDPVLRHADMNDNEQHDEIADALINELCPVSREHAQAALCDVAVAVEQLGRLDAALAAI